MDEKEGRRASGQVGGGSGGPGSHRQNQGSLEVWAGGRVPARGGQDSQSTCVLMVTGPEHLFPVLAGSPLLGVGSQRKEFSGASSSPEAETGLTSGCPTN